MWDFSGFNVVNGRMVRARTGRYWECANGACPHRAILNVLKVRARTGRYWECANVLIASFRSHSASVRKNKRACSPLILNAEFVNVLVC